MAPRGPMDRATIISKALSKLLRHQASSEGIVLDERGYANVADVLAWNRIKSLKATLDEIKEVVSSNEKQRFNLIFSPTSSTSSQPQSTPELSSPSATESNNPADYLIRANQGHSIVISSAALGHEPLTLEAGNIPSAVVHGTYYAAWQGIMEKGGLSCMGRGQVHFADFVPEDINKSKSGNDQPKGEKGQEDEIQPQVLDGSNNISSPDASSAQATEKERPQSIPRSGMRKDAQILIYMDVAGCLQKQQQEAQDSHALAESSRLKWWKSANNVILSEGDSRGIVGVEWFQKIVDRRAGNRVLWEKGVGESGQRAVEEVLGEWKRGLSSAAASRGGRGGKRGQGRGGGRGRGGKGELGPDGTSGGGIDVEEEKDQNS